MRKLHISDVTLIVPEKFTTVEAAFELFSRYIPGLDEMNYEVKNEDIFMKKKDSLSGAQILENFEDGSTSLKIFPITKQKYHFNDGEKTIASFIGPSQGTIEYCLEKVIEEHEEYSLSNYSVFFDKDTVIIQMKKK